MPAPKGHPPYNKNGEGGRPTKYTDEFIEKEAEAFLEWMKLETSAWFETFAFERGYTPDMFSIWAKTNERFSGVYKISQAWQKQRLISFGLFSKFNSNIVKLVLANTIGWTDKQQVSGDAVNPLAFLMKESGQSTKELVDESFESEH